MHSCGLLVARRYTRFSTSRNPIPATMRATVLGSGMGTAERAKERSPASAQPKFWGHVGNVPVGAGTMSEKKICLLSSNMTKLADTPVVVSPLSPNHVYTSVGAAKESRTTSNETVSHVTNMWVGEGN